MIKFALLLLPLFMLASLASAGCRYDGKNYPDGSVIGPYVCHEGKWVKK